MISSKAVIKNVRYQPNIMIYGRSIVEDDVILMNFVEIGFPSRDTLKKFFDENKDRNDLNLLIEYGEGSIIRQGSLIRSFNVIYEKTELGRNVRTGHHIIIRENTKIGDDTVIGSGTIIDGDVVIGRNVSIQSGVYIPPKVYIGDNVFIGPRAVFTNDRYPPSRRLIETIVEDDVVIGANSVIIAGIRIGKRSVVGAGSVVTKDVPSNVVVAGNPAKVLMSREEYERKKRVYEENIGRLSVS